ncbi:MAG: ribosome-associated translation inhibitor RaiA [Clostridia bacterium]|nr:ribosome-associated translation inhibitor RaiA [Clostridia bacterium]
MKYNVICRKVELSDSRKEKLLGKLKKLDKFFDEELECKVLVSEQKNEIVMEITILNKGFILRAEARNRDLIAAADECLSNLDRQIRKHKTKLAKHLHRPVIEEYNSIVDSTEEVAEENAEFKIIKKKKVESKPMSAEEAVLQMNMLGHDFFIFLNPDTRKDNIVYRRKDGNYGLIEAE